MPSIQPMSSLNLNPEEYPLKIEARVVGYGTIEPNQLLTLDHVQLKDRDYSGRKLRKFTSIASRFERCRFDAARFDNFAFGSGHELSEYIDCSFDGARFDDYLGGFARFVRCSFKDVDIRDWQCHNTELIDCVFTGRLTECIFYGTVPEQKRPWVGREKNEFRGNDFSGCDLVDVAFRTGIDLSLQRLPTGPEYLYLPDAAAAIERARTAVNEWHDAGLREEGLSLLIGLGFDIERGQHQDLLRAEDCYTVYPREVVDGVFSALRG